jgi:ketosteroid isomerase-like protein
MRKRRISRALIGVMVAVALMATAAPGQENRSARVSKAEQQILALNREWADAIARGDMAALDRLFADDLTVISGRGELRTKAQELDDLRPNPDITTYFFNTEDARVRVYKDAAVVTGLARWRIRYQGKDIDHERRYTSVFVKQHGRWRIVAQQLSRPPERPAKASQEN